ncbi:MAG: DHHW family protein, partial [Oscillospiraceae bacterium]
MMADRSNKDKNPSWPAFYNVALLLAVLTMGGVFALLHDRPTVSLLEKRELTTFPSFSVESLLHGDYAQGLSLFFADTFPARDSLMHLASVVRESGGVRFDDIRIHGGNVQDAPPQVDTLPPAELPPPAPLPIPLPDLAPAPSEAPAERSEPAVPQPPEDDGEVGVRNGAIFVYKGKGYQIFGGSDAMGAAYAQAINAYQRVLGDRVQIYNLVVPSAIGFAIPERYQSMTTPELPRIEYIDSQLDPGIQAVDVYHTIEKHKKEYLYFNTDHHWTSLGAYYAYVEFCKAAGLEPVPLDSLEKRTLDGFLGTLYSQTQDSKLLANPDHVDYYMMPTKYQCYQYRKNQPFTPYAVPLYGEYALPVNSYSVYLHGDFPLTRIDTEIKNGRKIAVVKESYGNAFVPYLVNHYEQILVVDDIQPYRLRKVRILNGGHTLMLAPAILAGKEI